MDKPEIRHEAIKVEMGEEDGGFHLWFTDETNQITRFTLQPQQMLGLFQMIAIDPRVRKYLRNIANKGESNDTSITRH